MKLHPSPHGPFHPAQLRSGDPYELSDGHAIECFPTGGRGSLAEGSGYQSIATDPGVEDVGIDTGYTPSSRSLRAPDLSVGKIPDRPGWVEGAPRLAVEYVDTGQDEDDLPVKIRELLAAGTELVWVVRLTGPRRVEVHRPGEPMRTARPGEELEAPGILEHPLPVEALYDREVSNRVALRNLLERHGFASPEQLRDEGRTEGELEALRADLLAVFEVRQLPVDEGLRARIADCRDRDRLRRWHRAAVTAPSADAALAD